MTDGIDLDRLEALAANATPGPWRNDRGYVLCARVDEWEGVTIADAGRPNADFIAALDPDTVRALIKRVKTAEAERDALAAKIEQVRALASANNRLRDSENACMLYAPSILAILDQNKEGEQ